MKRNGLLQHPPTIFCSFHVPLGHIFGTELCLSQDLQAQGTSLMMTNSLHRCFGIKKIFNNSRNHAEQYYQLGIASYIGEYGDFHTWIMLKSRKNSLIGNWKTYPVFKFFKGDFLIEIGYDSDLDWDIHMMYRF